MFCDDGLKLCQGIGSKVNGKMTLSAPKLIVLLGLLFRQQLCPLFALKASIGYGSKLNHQGTADFSP